MMALEAVEGTRRMRDLADSRLSPDRVPFPEHQTARQPLCLLDQLPAERCQSFEGCNGRRRALSRDGLIRGVPGPAAYRRAKPYTVNAPYRACAPSAIIAFPFSCTQAQACRATQTRGDDLLRNPSQTAQKNRRIAPGIRSFPVGAADQPADDP